MSKLKEVIEASERIKQDTDFLISQLGEIAHNSSHAGGVDPFVFGLTVFILACFVGYFVVWRVTPALHTPLMAVTNAISSVIIVGAIIALGTSKEFTFISLLSFIAILIASINIFGGFFVTYRMLEMFKK
jgi:NAD(P) transhydrogenase subunit alpha